MLLPDGIHPEDSIYCNGAFVLQAAQQNPSMDLLGLYQQTKEMRDMSMSIFILCLDWLFLLDVLDLNAEGRIELCI
jgi:hypothetical protein